MKVHYFYVFLNASVVLDLDSNVQILIRLVAWFCRLAMPKQGRSFAK